MKENILNPKFIVLTLILLGAAFTRLIPHYPNFTAIGAMALFGGAYMNNKKIAFAIPLLAMFLTDMIIGFHTNMLAVYLSFAAIVFIGFGLKNKKRIPNIFLASVSASVLFFIVTNFSAWIFSPIYPKTAAGLAMSYTAAIPFFHYTMLGDLFYVGIMFGVFELAKVKFAKLAEV